MNRFLKRLAFTAIKLKSESQATIAIDDKDGCIITTDLINCKDHQSALTWAEYLCKTAASSGILINDKIY